MARSADPLITMVVEQSEEAVVPVDFSFKLNSALRPLRGLAHGLQYPAHFGADSAAPA